MSAPYLGGMTIVGASWASPTALIVYFSSTWGTAHHYQLYAGRTLIGVTTDPSDRTVTGQLQTSLYPQHLTLLAVDPSARDTDYGASLPKRPYNRVKVTVDTTGWPADAKQIEVTAGTAPGGAVDADNRVAFALFDVEGSYTLLTDPLNGTGTWNLEVAGRDDRETGGNLGDPLELAVPILAHPPDVLPDGDGTRLTVSVAGGVATVGFTPQF